MKSVSTGSLADIQAAFHINWETLSRKLKRFPQSWQISIAVFLAGRVLFSMWGAVIWYMRLMPTFKGPFYFNIEPVLEGTQGALLGIWQRWDSIHYQQIAMAGYINDSLTAFFPLYPLLGRWVSFLTGGNMLLGLIVVSNIATLLAMWLLYQIVSEVFTTELAFKTLFSLIIFPSAFFFYSIYPQSLLLMFVLLAYWLARKRLWAGAGLSGFCAGLTHSTAVALTPLLIWEVWYSFRHKKEGNRIAMIIAPVTNLLGIGAFLAWRHLVGFPPYQNMLGETWSRNITMPWDSLITVAKIIINLPFDPIQFMAWINVFVFVIIVGLTIWSFRKIPHAMWIYQTVLLIMLLSTTVENNPLLGILRYPLVMFPIFIEFAMVGNTKVGQLIKFSVFVLLSLVCSAWFLMWKFVA